MAHSGFDMGQDAGPIKQLNPDTYDSDAELYEAVFKSQINKHAELMRGAFDRAAYIQAKCFELTLEAQKQGKTFRQLIVEKAKALRKGK